MEQYKNLGGDSNVTQYEFGDNFIEVQFGGTFKTYRYSYTRAGRHHVENMKSLAVSGQGLNEYINKHVRKLYD